MSFQSSTTDKKMDPDSDDELDCMEESIVHAGDHRVAIHESEYNKEDIIKCIGQLEILYKYSKQQYQQTAYGTATVITTENNKTCVALTVAHNARRKITECQACKKYMDCIIDNDAVVRCEHCGDDKLQYKIISATKIRFKRREILKNRLVPIHDEDEKCMKQYTFGDNKQCYDCTCIYVDDYNYNLCPMVTGGYDFALLSFENTDNYNYSKYCKNIRIKNEMDKLEMKNI
eukprot:549503_1